jgi:hypothetical protein
MRTPTEYQESAAGSSRFVVLQTIGNKRFFQSAVAATAVIFWPVNLDVMDQLTQFQTNWTKVPSGTIRVYAWIRMIEEHPSIAIPVDKKTSAEKEESRQLIANICEGSTPFVLDVAGQPEAKELASLVKRWLDELIEVRNTNDAALHQCVQAACTRFEVVDD